jgi:hypothetical protein
VAVAIQSIKKCGFLRQMVQQAKTSASTLAETLLAAATGHFVPTFARGRLVVSQSGSGQSGSFEIGMTGKEWTQDNIFALIEELQQMLAARVADTDAGTPDSSDPTLLDALQAGLIADINAGLFPQSGVTRQMIDVSGLNWPATAGAIS